MATPEKLRPVVAPRILALAYRAAMHRTVSADRDRTPLRLGRCGPKTTDWRRKRAGRRHAASADDKIQAPKWGLATVIGGADVGH